jgi:hypothetical protein
MSNCFCFYFKKLLQFNKRIRIGGNMVMGTNNCPFCDEEVYCIESLECICCEDTLPHWPLYEQYKCPHCGVFNMCIDRRLDEVQNRVRNLQPIAAEENIKANQNKQYIFWLDQPPEKAVCNPEIKLAIKNGEWVVKQIQDFE